MTHTDKCRLDILTYSLGLEFSASYVLGFIFDREDFEETKSFGNKSTSLSFNQKMLLLMDYGAIEKNDKVVLDGVMNIRNQFLHNANCLTYQDAFKAVDGLQNKFMKLFENNFVDDNDMEKNLEKSVSDAFNYSIKVFKAMTTKGGLKNKLWLKSERDTYKFQFEKICKEGILELYSFRHQIINDDFDYQDKNVLLEKFDKVVTEVFKLKSEDVENLKDNVELF